MCRRVLCVVVVLWRVVVRCGVAHVNKKNTNFFKQVLHKTGFPKEK